MLEVNAERLLADLESLSGIGATADGGVDRPALSEADLQGRAWFKQRAEEAGFEFRQDGAGNLFAKFSSQNPLAKTLLAGSHLDSVPNGGRFDGPLGVLSVLESARTIEEAGIDLPVHLETVSFTDEEGTWLGLLGSRAFIGALSSEDLRKTRGGVQQFDEALNRIGCSQESLLRCKCDPSQYAGFVEVHIEQGTRLAGAKLDIGVVSEIVGIRWHWLRFVGEAAHAGTMPMAHRKDAFWGAAWFSERAKDLIQSDFFPGVMNCGQLTIQPGAFNIVPAEVQLGLEIRHGSPEKLDAMQTALFSLAEKSAEKFGLALETESVSAIPPVPLDETVVAGIESAAAELGLTHTRLLSFAGHDTQSLSTIMPSAMFFVPSVDGISHNPRELTHPDDVVNSANVMLQTLLKLAAART